jgi:pimeloyl-ACP methyl ester carboxylesterase
MGEVLPIIYVRGFSGGQGGINSTVDDPFYGFNEGSTHIRVGAHGEPHFHQFEGPMLRLMLEDLYDLRVGGNQQQDLLNALPGSLPPNCVWVYRFYDEAAGTFGKEPKPYDIGEAAKGLAGFIALVRGRTAGTPRINLVAHSMGGLICRTVLQRELDHPETIVSKLCTIGTPHGGIDPELGGGIGDWLMKTVGPNGSDIFAPERMCEYMTPDDFDSQSAPQRKGKWDPRVMVGTFPTDRVLSIVGTNARDYEVAHGLSSLAMGEQSDGLVAVANAYVKKSARAYVHRSHSGRYGLLNSEEAYANLKRFLFGSLRVQIEIDGLNRDLLKDRVWQADARLAIRELPVLIHEQTAEHHCPVDLNAQAADVAGALSPVPLITMFLIPNPAKVTCRYALSLKVVSLKQEGGWFGFGDHLEQIADWEDSLIIDLAVENEGEDKGNVTGGWFAWNSALSGRIAEPERMPISLDWNRDDAGVWTGSVPVPPLAARMLGTQTHLQFSARLWD